MAFEPVPVLSSPELPPVYGGGDGGGGDDVDGDGEVDGVEDDDEDS